MKRLLVPPAPSQQAAGPPRDFDNHPACRVLVAGTRVLLANLQLDGVYNASRLSSEWIGVESGMQLPDYKSPPVIETILGIQFDPLKAFRNSHLGLFWAKLGVENWPVVSDAHWLDQEFEQFGEVRTWTEAAKLRLTQDPACRLQLRNSAGDNMVQLQNGRLHFNWIDRNAPYPRYTWVREQFVDIMKALQEFITDQKLGSFNPNQWEVTYLNDIPKGTVWESPSDWSFIRLLNDIPSLPGIVDPESFAGSWAFTIPGKKGRLHVQWRHQMKSAAPGDTREIIRVTMTARGPAATVDDVLNGVDLGRETIVCSFRDLMTDSANRFWGLQCQNLQ